MLVLSALLKDTSFYNSVSWYPELDLVCVFQYCDISHILFNLNKNREKETEYMTMTTDIFVYLKRNLCEIAIWILTN